jgi:DNA-binding response OmpR family regulator
VDKLKILVAEDDKTTQKFYDAFLGEDVFEKRLIISGEEALELYRIWRPDIIILDIMLPLISGYALLKMIREEMADKLTPILISSTLASKADIMDIAELGIQGYLGKPIQWKELACKVLDCYQKTYPDKTDYVATLKKRLEEKRARRSNEGPAR